MAKEIKKNINTEKPKGARLHDISMNNYVRPDYKKLYYNVGQYVLNGIDNKYYQFVEDRYYGSPTNAAIIDAYCNYVYGEGLMNNGLPVELITEEDLQLLIFDYKLQGQCALQVIYSNDRKSIAELAYVPIKSVGINQQADINDPIAEYWYSYDWTYRTKFTPVILPAFGTSDEPSELLVIRNTSNVPFFSLPDYQSGLQYAKLEEELSNQFLSHVENGLSFGHVINVFGVEEDPESQDAAEKSFVRKLTGSSNKNKFVMSFQDDPEKKTTIEAVPNDDACERFEFLTNESRDKILMAHKVVNPILFGVEKASGFSNNSDEMVTALKTLYRSQIKPIRNKLINALTDVFQINDPNVNLYFEDFEELKIKEEAAVSATPTEDNTQPLITE